jgi:3-O-methylgallate 3,4-dioxygenase
MLSTPPEKWGARVPADRKNTHHFKGRTWSFDELVEARKGEHLDQQITPAMWEKRYAACRAAIAQLAATWDEVKPDVAVIVGNDQYEIFKKTLQPAFSVFWGDTIVNGEYDDEHIARLPPGIAEGVAGHIPPGGASYAGQPALGEHIIRSTVADGFDITSVTTMPGDETPHAFGFVYRNVMSDRPVPSVPVILNTFFGPNQPPVNRCYSFGKAIVKAIESWDSDARVALIASGGLTHFVIDEEVDQTLIAAMKKGSIESVASLGEAIFQAGTSEVKNWVPVAGAMADLGFEPTVIDYVPCYRSEAGTGNAMGFVTWRP